MSPQHSARRSVTPEELAFAAMFGLPAHVAAILARLYASPDEPVEVNRFRISELRAAMVSEAIDTTPRGYHLTEEGRADCAKAITDFRAWVATETRKAG
jgi:hypothetical protein